MADNKEEKKLGELCHISLCRAENGWKINVQYENKQTLAERAGWVPCATNTCKDYVEKSKEAVVKRIKELL